MYSVESDFAWIQAIYEDPMCKYFINKKRLMLHYANIGPVKEWGTPVSEPNISWLSYHQDIWAIIPYMPEFVLIDGRFRVACTLQTLLHCKKDTVVLFHDFWNRRYYHSLLNFMDVLDRANTTAVLKGKNAIDWKALCKTLQAFQFDER